MTDQQIEELINEVQKRNKWSPLYKNRLAVDKEWEVIATVLKDNKDRLKAKWKNLRDVFQKEMKKIKKPRSGDPGSPETYTGKWCYFERMYFLKDTVSPRPTEGNYSSSSKNTFESHISIKPNEPETQDENPEQQTQQETANEMSETSQFVERSTQEVEETTQSPPSQIQTQPSLHPLPAASTSSSKNKKRKNEPQITPFEKAMLSIEEKKNSALGNTTDDDPDMLFLKSLQPFFKELSLHQKLRVRNQMQNILAEALSPSSSLLYTPSAQHSHSDNMYTYQTL